MTTVTGLMHFTYDMSDQPVAMTGEAPNTRKNIDASYLYDGNMKRVRSIIDSGDGNGPKTIYNVYDAAGRLVHVDEVGGGETDYLHGMGQTLARIKDGTFTYLHPDHLGSPQVGTKGQGFPENEHGDVDFKEHYTPFGEALLNPAANDNQSGFTGHIKDKGTGLNYMQARYYDPNIGRFLSIDPVTFVSSGNPIYFNRYAYTGNDPINFIDPLGQSRLRPNLPPHMRNTPRQSRFRGDNLGPVFTPPSASAPPGVRAVNFRTPQRGFTNNDVTRSEYQNYVNDYHSAAEQSINIAGVGNLTGQNQSTLSDIAGGQPIQSALAGVNFEGQTKTKTKTGTFQFSGEGGTSGLASTYKSLVSGLGGTTAEIGASTVTIGAHRSTGSGKFSGSGTLDISISTPTKNGPDATVNIKIRYEQQ